MSRLRGLSLAGVTEDAAGRVWISGEVNMDAAEMAWMNAAIGALESDILAALRDRAEALRQDKVFGLRCVEPRSMVPEKYDFAKLPGEMAGEDREALAGEATCALERPASVPAAPEGALTRGPKGEEEASHETAGSRRGCRFEQNMARRDRLRLVRKALGLRTDELAARCGISFSAAQNALASGTGQEAIARLVGKLGLDGAWLETGAGEMFQKGNGTGSTGSPSATEGANAERKQKTKNKQTKETNMSRGKKANEADVADGTNEDGSRKGAKAAKEKGSHEGTKARREAVDKVFFDGERVWPVSVDEREEPGNLVAAAAWVMRSARTLERALAALNRIAAGILEEVGK